jgi:hypothetical protein
MDLLASCMEREIYSASVDEVATTDCFWERQLIGEPKR